MRSVADDLRDERLRVLMELTPEQRINLALRLGEEALEFFMATNHLTRDEAVRRIRQERRAGRNPSRCMNEE
jgi:hypothetical protein